MIQINCNVCYNSNSDKDDDEDTFHDSIEGEVLDVDINSTTDDVNGEPINNDF